jgi:hypothetical protein
MATDLRLSTYDFACGCKAERLERAGALDWYVPLEACPEHCPCVGCQQTRAWQHDHQQQRHSNAGLVAAVRGW